MPGGCDGCCPLPALRATGHDKDPPVLAQVRADLPRRAARGGAAETRGKRGACAHGTARGTQGGTKTRAGTAPGTSSTPRAVARIPDGTAGETGAGTTAGSEQIFQFIQALAPDSLKHGACKAGFNLVPVLRGDGLGKVSERDGFHEPLRDRCHELFCQTIKV